MKTTRMTDEELAQEAAQWPTTNLSGWVDAPEAVPRHSQSVSVTIRLPKLMLDLLREFAQREGVGYQVLMKRWLDDRIRREAQAVRRVGAVVLLQHPEIVSTAASFKPPTSAQPEPQGEHAEP